MNKVQTEALNEISPWEDSRSTQEIVDDIISSRTIGDPRRKATKKRRR